MKKALFLVGLGLAVVAVVLGGFVIAGKATQQPALDPHQAVLASNEASVVPLTKGVTYWLRAQAVYGIDSCTVAGTDGTPVKLTESSSSPDSNGQKTLYNFKVPATGDYRVTCTAKLDGREIILEPTSTTDLLIIVALFALLGGAALMLFNRPKP